MERAELIIKVPTHTHTAHSHSLPTHPRTTHTHHTLTPTQVVMSPHEQAEEFILSYRKLMQGDTDVNNFHKVLEMKVNYHN